MVIAMTITASLILAKPNHMEYLIVADTGSGEVVYIESDGGATPDLLTDTVGIPGPLNAIARVKTNGYGLVTPGTLSTQAKARALLLSDDAAALVGPNVPTAMCRLMPRTGGGWQFTVDAVRGPSDAQAPGLAIAAPGAAGSAILIIEMPGAIGV